MRSTFHILIAALCLTLVACAQGDDRPSNERPVIELEVEGGQRIAVPSSVLRFRFLNSTTRESTGVLVRFNGVLDGGRNIDEEFYLPVDRIGDSGDLIVDVRVFDGLFETVNPEPVNTFRGAVLFELDDSFGTFAEAFVEETTIEFRSEITPEIDGLPVSGEAFVNQAIILDGDGFLRPEEGITWAVVDRAEIEYPDQSTRIITNARLPLEWSGTRQSATLRIRPEIFGVRVGEFSGPIRFANELTTGQKFEGSNFDSFTLGLRQSRIRSLSPPAGSRGQKITVVGDGFLPTNERRGYGMYFVFEGEFNPDRPGIPTQDYQGDNAFLRVPYRVVDSQTIEQDVWYEIENSGELSGLGSTPGVFRGMITPILFDAQGEQSGKTWTGDFRVLPTEQVVYVKYLPGFSSALEQYGLGNVEREVRDRVLYVLQRDYSGINASFQETPPGDFIEYTTIEIGGPDPSGLLNFGYDNSFNEGGKDIGNLYLSDYLGGVNRHSQSAGFLPYGGVFIESFIAFSPSLFPGNFGTADAFDRVLSPFMPELGGQPVGGDEWPEGSRVAAIRNAIDMLGNLTGHTASHEIGHSLGLAHFPASVEGFEERFHNDPPGDRLIMDAGADRPFGERAELDGRGPARFSDENLDYLISVLPEP